MLNEYFEKILKMPEVNLEKNRDLAFLVDSGFKLIFNIL